MSAAEPDGDWPEYEGEGMVRRLLRRWGRLGGIVAALGMAVVFAVAAWYALQRSDMQPTVMAEVPLVQPEPGPVKEKPEDPGGLKIPNQDKLVFERITPKPEAPMAEKLAPAPEEPIVKMNAPPAPALANARAEAPADAPAKTVAGMAKPMTGQIAKSTAGPATARQHAAPPAIPNSEDKAMASKVESLLPGAGGTETAAAGGATVPAPKAQAMAQAKAQSKALPNSMAKSPAAAPLQATKIKAPKIKAPKIKAPIASTPAAKAVESGYRIQLVSHRTAKRADAAWLSLQKAHADVLGNLAGHTARVDLGKRGIFYRVQAGFFRNEALARSACGKLKAKRQDCIIVPPQ
ncbi:MAG: SPOR domain-containing protein [Alphaproteobacteria bacterium]|nr:SPOR domain-containing protein [Alphaproteobacteria bacterium]